VVIPNLKTLTRRRQYHDTRRESRKGATLRSHIKNLPNSELVCSGPVNFVGTGIMLCRAQFRHYRKW